MAAPFVPFRQDAGTRIVLTTLARSAIWSATDALDGPVEFGALRTRRAVAWRIWMICFLGSGFFFSGPGNWNVMTRMGLTLAVIDRHALTIGPFAAATGDLAIVDGQAYSDKAPGLSFLAVPVAYVVGELIAPGADEHFWMPRPRGWPPQFTLLTYLSGLFTVGVLTASAATAMFLWTVSRGASVTAGALAALAYALATPTFGWSTIFFGHAACGALLLLGYVTFSAALHPAGVRGIVRASAALAAGLALGLAFDVEFPAAPAIVLIGALCALEALRGGMPFRTVLLAAVIAASGVALLLLLLMIYNAAAFGSPLTFGYAKVPGFQGMRTGFFGISYPRADVAGALLFGLHRGLLPLSPILVLTPLAVAICLRIPRWRTTALVGTGVFAWYLIMNAGYYYWDGGWSTGPRHIVPSLPFLAIPLAALWDHAGRAVKALFLLLFLVSVAISVICAAVDMTVPTEFAKPFFDSLLPRFLDGDMPRAMTRFTKVPGPAVLPLVIAWLIIGWPIARSAVRQILRPGGSEANI